jgi:hypothetical protein
MTIRIFTVCFCVLLFLTTGCKTSPPVQKESVQSPSDIIRSFYSSANQGRYDDFEHFILPSTVAQLKQADPLAMKHMADKASEDGTLQRVDILHEAIRGQGASVSYAVVFKNGTSHKRTVAMILEGNSWKIADVAHNDDVEPTHDTNAETGGATGQPKDLAVTPTIRAAPATSAGFTAVISCGMSGNQNLNVLGCFAGDPGTEIELHNGDQYGLYKAYQIPQLGTMTDRGLEIKLQGSFQLVAQNSSRNLILGVRILADGTGQQVFAKQVSQFGTIDVSN